MAFPVMAGVRHDKFFFRIQRVLVLVVLFWSCSWLGTGPSSCSRFPPLRAGSLKSSATISPENSASRLCYNVLASEANKTATWAAGQSVAPHLEPWRRDHERMLFSSKWIKRTDATYNFKVSLPVCLCLYAHLQAATLIHFRKLVPMNPLQPTSTRKCAAFHPTSRFSMVS